MEAFVESHLKLLELERQEEISSSQSVLSSSPKVLAAKGLCLPKMRLSGIRTGLYGRTLAEFECAPHREMPANTFSSGDLVGIQREKAPAGDSSPSVSSVLLRMAPRGVVLALDDASEGEGLEEDGLFRLVKVGSDVTYRRIKKGLQQLLSKARDGPAAHLVDVLFGSAPPAPTPPLPDLTFLNEGLDDSQREAVSFALARPDVAIIHGPPGTGKTTTLVELLRQAVGRRKLRVLACAPSNVAVDNLLERLSRVKPKIRLVRLGHAARVLSHLQPFTLDAQLTASDAWQLVSDVRKEMDETRRLSSRRPTDAFRLRGQLADLRRELRSREAKALEEIFGRADIVLSTLTGLHEAKALAAVPFDLTVIDECSQSVEAACWLALRRAPRCVLAGDHLQLPPTVVSREAASGGLELSLMERLLRQCPGEAVTRMLTVQYRMHEAIMKWSGGEFYEGRLTAHESVRCHGLLDLPHSAAAEDSLEEARAALLLVDTAGCQLSECSLELSRGNLGEADLVAQLAEQRVRDWGLRQEEIGVITPYNLQVELIRNRVKPKLSGVEVRTVDGFQGREKEVIILSLVRSNDKGEVGFLAEHRRLNVAVTRARRQLVVVCDSETLSRGEDKVIRRFVTFLQNEGCVRSAQEWIQASDVDIGAPRPEDAFSVETSGPAAPRGAKKAKSKAKLKKGAPEVAGRKPLDKKPSEGRRPLPEAEFEAEVRDFLLSAEEEKSFPDSLEPFQRAAIHEIAEKLGLIHESVGEGKSRHLVLRKRKDEKAEKAEEVKEDEEEEEEEEEKEEMKEEVKDGKRKKRNRKKKKGKKVEDEKEEREKEGAEMEKERAEMEKEENIPNNANNQDPIMRQLQEYRERQRSLRQPQPETAKGRKERRPQKPALETQLATLDGDDFDALVAAAQAADRLCAAPSCRAVLSIMGRRCVLCHRTFCSAHALPEAHGCGAAAKEAARKPRIPQGGASAAIRKAQLEHRMGKKLGEMAAERKAKKKEKEK